MAVHLENLSSRRTPEVSEQMWDLYKNSIALFWRNRERILSDPKLFYVRTPFSIRAAYIGIPKYGESICLGVLLKAWAEHAELFTLPCPKCGGEMKIYSFAGSPMSGMGHLSCRCVDCDYLVEHKAHGDFSALSHRMRKTAEQHAAREAPDALTFEEAVNLLKTE